MELKLKVTKKQFTDKGTGEIKQYYDMRVQLDGQEFKVKADDKDKKMMNYFLDKCDIPLEKSNRQEELMRKLLDGEELSKAEKEELKRLLDGEDDEGGED